MNKTVKNIYKIVVLFTSILLLMLSLIILFQTYDNFIFTVLDNAGKLDKIEKFKADYLSKTKFQILRFVIVFFTVSFYLIILRKFSYFEEKIIGFVDFIYNSIKSEIHSISKTDKYLFFVIFLITGFIKLYYFFTQPITNDEAFTYLNYVKPGFLAALSYYNLTNNHILHSILCNVFDLLPLSPVFSLRIASFTVGLISMFAAFLFFNKFLNAGAKFVAFAFFAFSLPVLQYGILARGYSLLLFFTIISNCILLVLTKNTKNRKKLWVVFIISSVLGFYSLPVYVYVYASQTVYYSIISLKNKRIRYFKEFLFASFSTAIVVGVLYAPVLFINGIDAFIGYDFMQSLPLNEFLKYYPEFIHQYFIWVSGNNRYLAVFVLILLIIALFYSYKSKKILFLFILSFLITPFIMLVFQKIIPFNRLFIFNSLIIALAFGLFVELLLKKVKFSKQKVDFILLTGVVVMSIILLLSFAKLCKQEKEINNKAYRFANQIQDNSSIFSTNEVRYYTFLKFKAMYLDKKKIHLYRTDFNKNYPYTYIAEDKDKNERFIDISIYKYQLIYEDEYICLYKIWFENS